MSAGGAACPPFPVVLSGTGHSVEWVSTQARGGSRRPGSPLLSKHLEEADVVTHAKSSRCSGVVLAEELPTGQ